MWVCHVKPEDALTFSLIPAQTHTHHTQLHSTLKGSLSLTRIHTHTHTRAHKHTHTHSRISHNLLYILALHSLKRDIHSIKRALSSPKRAQQIYVDLEDTLTHTHIRTTHTHTHTHIHTHTNCLSHTRSRTPRVHFYARTHTHTHTHTHEWRRQTGDTDIPPRNGEIALWSNPRVAKCKYCVSQKRNEANNKGQWYNILLTFISLCTERSFPHPWAE